MDSEGVCIQIGSERGSMIVVLSPHQALRDRISKMHQSCMHTPMFHALVSLANYIMKFSLLDRTDLAFTSDSDEVPESVQQYFGEGNNDDHI